MNEVTPELMDDITDTIILALNAKYVNGLNIGVVSTTLAALSVALMGQHHSISVEAAKALVCEFIHQAPLHEMKAIPLSEI